MQAKFSLGRFAMCCRIAPALPQLEKLKAPVNHSPTVVAPIKCPRLRLAPKIVTMSYLVAKGYHVFLKDFVDFHSLDDHAQFLNRLALS